MIRRIFCSVFIFILFINITQAQNSLFGLQGGLNASNVSGDFSEIHSIRIGYQLGGFAKIGLSDRFYFNTGLLYNSVGNLNKYDVTDFNIMSPHEFEEKVEYVDRYNYLSIPLSFSYQLSSLSFGIGPQVSFLLNRVGKFEETFNPGAKKITSSGDFKFEYGGLLSLGCKVISRIFLQLDYYYGLNNLIDGRFSSSYKNYHRSLQLSAGYVIF